MVYFLFTMLFKLVASFFQKVTDFYEQSNRSVSSAVGAYWNPCFSKSISLCKSILLIGLCHDLRISCNSWFYFLFDTICMSLDMICISKRAINFHPLISIKANGITSRYNGQPRTVTSSYKFAAPKKDQKANHFWSNYFKV